MTLTVSVDAMGGDHAPSVPLEGLFRAIAKYPHVHFLIFGDKNKIDPLLEKQTLPKGSYSLHHTDEVVTSEMKPSHAVRRLKNSSMRLAIDAVKMGQAQAVVSAGNTGAYMATAKLVLRTLPGVDRPAITALMPTATGRTAMLDLGANAECSPQNLVQFALMGQVFAQTIMGLKRPSIGLLNVGEEQLKGSTAIQTTQQTLAQSGWLEDFYGFVEGDDILAGTVDVVVTDGFTGNVALKAMEGTYRLIRNSLQGAYKKSLLSKFGYLLSKSALSSMKAKLDPRVHNGAIFLGLDGIAVKSHGGTDGLGFENALKVAIEMAEQNVNSRIKEGLEHLNALSEADEDEDPLHATS